MWQQKMVKQNIIQEEGRAVVPEPKLQKVKQVGEDGVGWAVVPEPPFLSRPFSSFFFKQQQVQFRFFFRDQWGGRWVCRRLLCQGADLCCGGKCGRRLWMSHSVLCRWSILRLVRAAHRAAVDLTIRDIPVWLWCGYRSWRGGRRGGRALCSAGWVAERILEFLGYSVGWGSLQNEV